MKKRILSVLLALSMTAGLAAPAWASEPGEAPAQLYGQAVDGGTIVTSAGPGISLFSLADKTVDLASGAHEKWFDRLAPETEYAVLANTFYHALEEGSDNDGIDDFLIGDQYFTTSGTSVGLGALDTLAPGQFVNASFQYDADNTNSFTGIYVGTVAKDDADYARKLVTAAYNAFDRDHPEVFWLSGRSENYSVTAGDNVYLFFTLYNGEEPFSVREDGYLESGIKSKITARDGWIAAIQGSITGYSGMADYEKVRAFDDWLTKHNEYNTSGDLNNIEHETRECLSALEGRTGENGPVCEGYARAFKVLCDQAGIPCVLVDGTAKSSPGEAGDGGAHMWNYAQVEGKWYGVDVTWDDPTGGSGGAVSGVENQNWLLVGSNTQVSGITFGASHPVSNTVSTAAGAVAFTNGPALEPEKFKPALKTGDFTVTLPASAVYTGEAIKATVAAAEGVEYTGAITVTYKPASGVAVADPVNAGTYDILVSTAADETYAATENLKVGTLTITKADAVISNPGTVSVTVGGSKPLGVSASSPEDAVLSYASSDGSVVSVDASGTITGVALGSATVTVSFAGTGNYNGKTLEVAVTVGTKEAADVSFSAKTSSVPYTGSPVSLGEQFQEAASDQGGGTMTYQYEGRTYNALSALPSVTNAGTYTVKAVYESESHYGEAEAVFTITKAGQAPLTVSSANTVKYGQTLTLTASGGSGTGELTWTVTDGTGSATVTGGVLTPVKAGTVTVTAAKAGDANYNSAVSDAVTVTIAKGDAPADVVVAQNVQWSLSQVELTLTGGPAGQGDVTYGAPTVTEDNDSILDAQPILANGQLTATLSSGLTVDDVGKTARITVSVTSENYEDYHIIITLTLVDKLDQAPLTVTSNAVTFPNTLRLTVSGGTTGGAVAYTVTDGTGSATISGSILTPVKAGTVIVTAIMAGDEDYNDVSSAPATITIAKGTPRVTPAYTAINTTGKTLADANLGINASATVPAGTIAWNDALTTLVLPNSSYQWTFIPDAAYRDNYNNATGSIVLWRYTPPEPETETPGSTTSSSGESVSASGDSTTVKPSVSTSKDSASAVVSEELGQQLVSQAVRTGSRIVTIAPEIKRGVTDVTVSIPAGTVRELGSRTGAGLRVATPVANVTIPNGALASLASRGGEVAISTAKEGGLVSVEVISNGSRVSQVEGGMTAEIPTSFCTSGTVAMLVSSDGTTKVVRKSLPAAAGSALIVPLEGSAQLRIADNSKNFLDMASSNWAASAVAFVSSREIMNGTAAGSFSPSEPMTRGMLAVVLHNMEDNPKAASVTQFPDVGSSWYTEAVQWAASQNIVSGYGDGSFGPNDLVTREQLAVMLYRFAGQPAPSGYTRVFLDSGQVSAWAGDAVRWAAGAGILSGSEGRLNPGSQATRAEAASMLMRFMQYMNG